MAKTEAIEEFLGVFKKSFNFASLYSKDHPTFLKSIEDLKIAADALFVFLKPVTIGCSTSSLLIEGQEYADKTTGEGLAGVLHSRKIKSITIRPNITSAELASLLSCLAQRPKEILRSGGINKILLLGQISGLSVEELSYQQLLRSSDEDARDIWVYLLSEAVREKDTEKINEVADNFEQMTSRLKVSDYLQDGQLETNMKEFLAYLNNNQKEKFAACSRQILKSVLSDIGYSDFSSVGKIKEFLKNVEEGDLAADILEEIARSGSIDKMNLKLFMHLFDAKQHERIAQGVAGEIKKSSSLRENPLMRKKMREFFSSSDDPLISEIYRNAIFSLLKDISFSETLIFDRAMLKANYRWLLLNLMFGEKSRDKLELVFEQELIIWDEVAREKDWGYIKLLTEALGDTHENVLAAQKLRAKTSEFIEDSIWLDQDCQYLASLLEFMKSSHKDAPFYLKKIFEEGRVNPCSLRAFFKFFPSELSAFYYSLETKSKDFDFLSKIIRALSQAKVPEALQVYEYLFAQANDLMRVEILGAMREAQDRRALEEILDKFLLIPSPFGFKNKLIMQNLSIVEELDLRDALKQLEILGKRKFFWNRALRNKAQAMLEKWNAGKH